MTLEHFEGKIIEQLTCAHLCLPATNAIVLTLPRFICTVLKRESCQQILDRREHLNVRFSERLVLMIYHHRKYPSVFVTEIKPFPSAVCQLRMMRSDITLHLFAVDCLKHMSGLGLQFIGRLTLGHIKKEEVQKMNDFPGLRLLTKVFVDLQVDKEHLRRAVMGNKDQQSGIHHRGQQL